MKNLWKQIPPFLSDIFGLQEVINQTEGMALIDDSGGYRPRPGQDRSGDLRVVDSHIRSEDVVGGTRQKLLDAFHGGQNQFGPKFVLICAAPCAAMIGTDMSEVAEQITRESGLPAAALDFTGHKTFENGVSRTLEAMAKLVVQEPSGSAEGVNLVGGSAMAFGRENQGPVERWAEENCGPIVSKWGGKEKLTNLKKAANARCSLVTTVAGLRTAKYLNSAFGVSYVAGAPFGRSWSRQLLEAVQTGVQPEAPGKEDGAPEVLILGEQFLANALRATLRLDYGMHNIQVCSFFTMEKSLQQAGDKKLKGEDDLKALLAAGNYKLIFADRVCRPLAPEGAQWVDLPSEASVMPGGALPCLVGERMNEWLDSALSGKRG